MTGHFLDALTRHVTHTNIQYAGRHENEGAAMKIWVRILSVLVFWVVGLRTAAALGFGPAVQLIVAIVASIGITSLLHTYLVKRQAKADSAVQNSPDIT